MKRIALYLLMAMTMVAAETPQELFQKALVKERSEGKLAEAIQLYRRAAEAAGKDRALAAKALVQLGQCYEKMGSTEARKQYDRVIRDYADQKDSVAMARARIGATGTHETGTVLRKIWADDNTDAGGRPSPDGRFFVYSDRASGGNLAIRDLSTGESRLLTRGKLSTTHWNAEYAGAAIISPEGKQIAYNWHEMGTGDTSLRLIGTDGARMRVLMNGVKTYPRVHSWSPDGKLIAITLSVSPGKTDIGLVSAQDGSFRGLKSTQFGQFEIEIGGFSTDGRFLTYAVPNTQQLADGGIFVIATDGTRDAPLVQGKSSNGAPLWTLDGRAIVFASNRSGTNGLWSIQVEDGKPKGSPELLRDNMGGTRSLGFSRDGSYFFGMANVRSDIYVADFDQESLRTSPPKPLSDRFVGRNSGLSWSPDGKWLAFKRGVIDQQTLVIRSELSGEERTLPTKFASSLGVILNNLNWFPDSRSLLVADIVKNRKVFRRIDIETGQERVVFEGPAGIWPMVRLSPDGGTLYYSIREELLAKSEGLVRLMKRNLETGEEMELYRAESSGAGVFGLSVSPDGRRLAFMVNLESPHRVLFTLATEGGSPRELFRGDYENPLPFAGAWTSDSRNVLVHAKDGPLNRLWAIPTEGGAPRKLELTMKTLNSVVVSPDGRRVGFTGMQTKSEVWVIQNLFAEVRAVK